MELQAFSVVMPLVGVVVGLAGAIALESVRGTQTTKREARDRRERFQVETLIRLQQVLDEHFNATLDAFHLAKRWKVSPSPSADMLERRVDSSERLTRCYSELILLVSRIDQSKTLFLQWVYWLAANGAVEDDVTDALRQKRIDITQDFYAKAQAHIGRELQAILYEKRKKRAVLFRRFRARRRVDSRGGDAAEDRPSPPTPEAGQSTDSRGT